jgi:phosphoribosylglycinamide formyltransferase-1
MARHLRLAVLISGGGTTLANLLRVQQAGGLRGEIVLVVSNNPASPGLQMATEAGIATEVIDHRDFVTNRAFSAAIFESCRDAGVDFVVMGGWLRLVYVPEDFEHRVVNIHPSLLPKHGGKGFYGRRVHEAVLAAGEATSGCTIHFVDNEYDHGPVILQRQVSVEPGESAESLAARVFAAECEAYPFVLNMLAEDRVRIEGRQVLLLPDPHEAR